MPDPISLFNGVPKAAAAAAAKKKEQNSQKRLLHRSFHLPIERTIDRTIAGAFDRLIV